jgi:small-conductance mechanosensitive channel
MQVELHIAYDSDLDEASRVIVDALNKVEVVLPDKGVEVLLVDFSDTARKLLVRWWVADYHQPWKKVDMVCRAIDAALDEAGIEIPITVYDLNVRMESRNSVSKMQEKVEK